jgi:hypothetical protein
MNIEAMQAAIYTIAVLCAICLSLCVYIAHLLDCRHRAMNTIALFFKDLSPLDQIRAKRVFEGEIEQ